MSTADQARNSGDTRPCAEIASGVYCLEVGKGFMRSNVYFVRSGLFWVLIDTASADCGRRIQQATDSLFGVNARPASILLTHDHPDHAGSALELVRAWGCPVYLHPNELPLAVGGLSIFQEYANPLDRWIILPFMRAMPRGRAEAIISRASLKSVAQAFDPAAGVPFLPDWECISLPGHTPGEVAFFRTSDRVLITGDAILTVDLNSLWGSVRWGLRMNQQRVSGPPWYSTWNWQAAKKSVAILAMLNPSVLAAGHGVPIAGTSAAEQLHTLADRFCGHNPAVA